MTFGPDENPWRCRTCGRLLGVRYQGKLYIRFKNALFVVSGPVTAVCRRCATVNEST